MTNPSLYAKLCQFCGSEISAEARYCNECDESIPLNYSEYIVYGYIRKINIFTPNDIQHLVLLYYGKYKQKMYDSDWTTTKICICSWNSKSNQYSLTKNNLHEIIARGYHLYVFGIKHDSHSLFDDISSILEQRGYKQIVLNDEKEYGVHQMIIYSGSSIYTGLFIKLLSKFDINKDNILCAILKIEQETVAFVSVNIASNIENVNKALQTFGFDWTCNHIVCFGSFGDSLKQYKNLNLKEPLKKLNEKSCIETILYYSPSSSTSNLLYPEHGTNISMQTGYYHNYKRISKSGILCGIKIYDPDEHYVASSDNMSSVGAVGAVRR